MAKKSNSTNNGTREEKFSSCDSRENTERGGVSFVEISKTSATHDKLFDGQHQLMEYTQGDVMSCLGSSRCVECQESHSAGDLGCCGSGRGVPQILVKCYNQNMHSHTSCKYFLF